MVFFLRLWILIIILTAISWVVLKWVRKPMHIGLVFLFWIVAVFGSTALLYLISVWFASS